MADPIPSKLEVLRDLLVRTGGLGLSVVVLYGVYQIAMQTVVPIAHGLVGLLAKCGGAFPPGIGG